MTAPRPRPGTYAWLFADEGGNRSLGLYENNSDAKRVASWAGVPGAMIHAFPTFDWRDTIVPVTGGGKGACTCETPAPANSPRGTAPTFGPCKPTVQCATLKLQYTGTVLPLARFMGINMLQELDAQNEFFIDSAAEKLYFYPPKPLALWAPGEELVISKNATCITMTNVAHVTLLDLKVVSATGTGISVSGANNTVVR
jgi:hypothetical protein